MNVTTLIFLGLAVVWAIVLLPELVRKASGVRRSDSIRSFNQQLSVLDRNQRGGSARSSNVIDLRSARSASRPVPAPLSTARSAQVARPVPVSVRKRRQDVLTALGAATVLTLVCTVAFGGAFLYLHLVAAALLVGYVVLLVQVAKSPARPRGDARVRRDVRWDSQGMSSEQFRGVAVSPSRPAARRVAN